MTISELAVDGAVVLRSAFPKKVRPDAVDVCSERGLLAVGICEASKQASPKRAELLLLDLATGGEKARLAIAPTVGWAFVRDVHFDASGSRLFVRLSQETYELAWETGEVKQLGRIADGAPFNAWTVRTGVDLARKRHLFYADRAVVVRASGERIFSWSIPDAHVCHSAALSSCGRYVAIHVMSDPASPKKGRPINEARIFEVDTGDPAGRMQLGDRQLVQLGFGFEPTLLLHSDKCRGPRLYDISRGEDVARAVAAPQLGRSETLDLECLDWALVPSRAEIVVAAGERVCFLDPATLAVSRDWTDVLASTERIAVSSASDLVAYSGQDLVTVRRVAAAALIA